MLRCILIASILLGVSFCTADTKRDKVSLEGDWILIQDTTKIFSGGNVGLRFTKDALLSLGNPMFWPQSQYIVNQDTVFIEELDGSESFYLIHNHTSDSLILSRDGHTERYYNRRLEYNLALKLDSITLETGECFGDCPRFMMTVHQDGTVEFEGFEHTKVLGKKALKMKNLDKLDSLFRWSYIDHLDTTKNYGVIDGWSTNIAFHYNERNTAKVNGTMMDMPFRLRELIAELTNLLYTNGLI